MLLIQRNLPLESSIPSGLGAVQCVHEYCVEHAAWKQRWPSLGIDAAMTETPKNFLDMLVLPFTKYEITRISLAWN